MSAPVSRIGTVVDLARMPGMPSAPTLRAIMRRHVDFPTVTAAIGHHGQAIDLDRAAAFVVAHWTDGRGGVERKDRRRSDTLAALADRPGMPSEPVLLGILRKHPELLIDTGGKHGPRRVDVDAAVRFVQLHYRDGRRAAASPLPLFAASIEKEHSYD